MLNLCSPIFIAVFYKKLTNGNLQVQEDFQVRRLKLFLSFYQLIISFLCFVIHLMQNKSFIELFRRKSLTALSTQTQDQSTNPSARQSATLTILHSRDSNSTNSERQQSQIQLTNIQSYPDSQLSSQQDFTRPSTPPSTPNTWFVSHRAETQVYSKPKKGSCVVM